MINLASRMITITSGMLEEIRTEKGGFTSAALVELGVSYPLEHGWQRKLVGSRVSEEQWARALSCRHQYSHGRNRSEKVLPPPVRLPSERQRNFLHLIGGLDNDTINALSKPEAVDAIRCIVAELLDKD